MIGSLDEALAELPRLLSLLAQLSATERRKIERALEVTDEFKGEVLLRVCRAPGKRPACRVSWQDGQAVDNRV